MLIRRFINNTPPGFFFSAASTMMFMGSGNKVVMATSAVSFMLVAREACCRSAGDAKSPYFNSTLSQFADRFLGNSRDRSLRIHACGSMLASLLSLCSPGAELIGFTGINYATGNFMASSKAAAKLQYMSNILGVKKLLTNPNFYYGIANSALGLMAGGGSALFVHPTENIPALLTTVLGVMGVGFASTGMIRDKFTDTASPCLMTCLACATNTVSGLLTGSYSSAASSGLGALGLFRLAVMNYQADKCFSTSCSQSQSGRFKPVDAEGSFGWLNRAYSFVSSNLVKPLKYLDRMGIIKPRAETQFSCS